MTGQPEARDITSGSDAKTPEPEPLKGLSADEAKRLLAENGENAITEKKESPLKKLLTYFWGPIPWMIEVAAILSGITQRWEDLAIIVVMLLINAGVGFFEEYKADNAIEALKQRLAPVARVLRDGKWQDLPARAARPRRRCPDQARQHRAGGRRAAPGRLSERRPVGADRRIAAGRQEGRRHGLFRLDRAPGRDAGRRHRDRHEDLLRQDRPTGRDGASSARTSSRRCCRIGNFLILITLVLVARDPRRRALPRQRSGQHPRLRADPDRCGDPGGAAGGAVGDHGGRRVDARRA